MAKTSVTISGFEKLDSALKQFEPKVQKKIVNRALRKAAKPVADRARQHAPVDTGDLRKSIKVRALRRSRKNRFRVGVRIVTSESDNLFQGRQFYGAFLEFGTAHIEPRPFLGRARDEMRGTVGVIFRQEIKAIIAETASESRSKTVKASGRAA